MATGSMRHFIRIEKLTGELNTSGNIDQTDWITYRESVRCSIKDASATESTRGDQVDATATHAIQTRFDPDISAQMRGVDHRGRVLNFLSAIDPTGLEVFTNIRARSQQ